MCGKEFAPRGRGLIARKRAQQRRQTACPSLNGMNLRGEEKGDKTCSLPLAGGDESMADNKLCHAYRSAPRRRE